jgi:hypothetical protein
MKITIDLTQEMFENVIVTALEGGSNYWYEINVDEFRSKLPIKAGRYNALTEKIAKALFTDPTFEMKVYDIENPEEVLGIVTQASMVKAFEIASKNYVTQFGNITNEDGDYDADDADVLFQLAVMGEVVFG